MKSFQIPVFYKSEIISKIKNIRRDKNPRKKDYSPTELDFGTVVFLISRHFGFCYGVENAIEISYKAIEENPGRKIYLLSEMIHNPEVNRDLQERGVEFIMDTAGNKKYDIKKLKQDDIVIIPAFGTTIEIQKELSEKGIEIIKYDTTCPFVEKVWNRASLLGKNGFTIILHGKYNHEETRATFSHSKENAPTLVIRDIEEAKSVRDYILGRIKKTEFLELFKGKYSDNFEPETKLKKIGVVNQTTMLATETEEISNLLKDALTEKYGKENINKHFADTRDTLCYATHDYQRATYALLENSADIAIVIGGYNSSNTTHIVKLCAEKLPTYFISSPKKILSKEAIMHFDINILKEIETKSYIPDKEKVKIILTSGASCPDSMVESVLLRLLSFFENTINTETVIDKLLSGNDITSEH
ncbi:MAG: 4-hydroxy-3-methylbut-2-enyl diphosphate reductase [Ignavibacteria bacterium]|nr:4-hydroxy-3-methylbut-2-enyl diphosphate reductase [Ignavibacteria bacterium]